MDEMEAQQESKTMGCGCLLGLMGVLILLICFLFIPGFFFQSIHQEVTNETVIVESSSPDKAYTLAVVQKGISFHGKYAVYLEAGDGTRLEVSLVSHAQFDASKVLIEWTDYLHATITLEGDVNHMFSFIAPNTFE